MTIEVIRKILSEQHFCNVHREHDRTSVWGRVHIIEPNRDDSDLFLKVMVFRCTNEIAAAERVDWSRLFDLAYIYGALKAWQDSGGKVFRTAAYKPPLRPELRGMGTLQCLFEHVLPPIVARKDELRPRVGDTLDAVHVRFCSCHGIGDFLSGQFIADLKQVEPLLSASDWHTFIVPGPGSVRGLNRLYGLPLGRKPSLGMFRAMAEPPRLAFNAELIKHGIAPVDGQDWNNCLCESDKLWRAIENGGKVSRKYKPTNAPLPGQTASPPPINGATAPGPMAAELAIMAAVEALEREAAPDQRTTAAEPETKQKADTRSNGPGPRDGYPHGERDTGTQADFYIYQHADGSYYLGVKRTSTKQFPQYHWTGQQWAKGLPKDFAKIPYRLPELLKAPRDAWVVIASGEKDAETAARLGFVATTNSGGEGKGQWTPELNAWFAGRKRVAIMEDNDATGKAHAIEVAAALRNIVPDIRIIGFRDLPTHGDLTDWIEADRSRGYAELLAQIEGAQAATGYELIKASAITMHAVQWWWAGHLARGELEILTGQPDIGKSQVHCSYVAHMTTGRDWPDKTKGPPVCDVVMLTAEDNMAHTLCPRLAAAGANLDRVLILNKIRKDNRDRMFLLQEDLDVLGRILASNPAIGLVTLDPITAYMGGKVDSHRATDVRNQLGPLKELAERSMVAFSAITHPAKKPGPKALDHYIGSQAFIAAPRLGHICIPEFEEGEDGRPKATGRFLFATPKHNIYFAMPTLAYRLVSASVGEIGISRVQWEEEVSVTADQALAATATAAKSKASDGVVTFLLDMLAGGPLPKRLIDERAAQRGFTADQLRRAREKAGIQTSKETGKKDGAWFWSLAQPDDR
jgi:hypothetical protein